MAHRSTIRASGFVLAMALSAFSEEQDPVDSRPRPVAHAEKLPASGFSAGACARYVALLHLSGTATADQGPVNGNRIALDDDLDLGSPSSIWEFGGRTGWWNPDYSLWVQGSYLRGRLRGHETLDTPQAFNGTVFAAGIPLDSAFRFDVAQLLLDVHPTLDAPDTPLDVGLFVGSTVVGSSVAIESPSVSSEEGVWQPAFGLGFSVAVKPAEALSIEGRIGYFTDLFSLGQLFLAGESTDVHTSIWDLSLAAHVRPVRFVTLEAGVRYFAAYQKTVTDDEYNEFRWSMAGFFAGLSAAF